MSASLKKAIDRFMLVLSTLYKIDPSSFSEASQVKGRKRVYFAENEETLLANGNTTKPKAIPCSNFWVITNNNTVKKINMLKEVAAVIGFNNQSIARLVGIFAPEHID